MKQNWLLHSLAALLCLSSCAPHPTPSPAVEATSCNEFTDALRVSFLDVGQGDATLITCPDKKTQLLVDAGTSDTLYPGGEEKFLTALMAALDGDNTIEYALNTHPDIDHIYGLRRLLASDSGISIQSYIDNGANNLDSEKEELVRELVKQSGIEYLALEDGKLHAWSFCGTGPNAAQFKIFAPTPATFKKLNCPAPLNDCSLVSRLEFQGVSFLFMADATLNWEKIALADKSIDDLKHATVLTLGHHANYSASRELLQTIAPQATVISTGQHEIGATARWGYPRSDVIDRVNHYMTHYQGETIDAKRELTACKEVDESCIWIPRAVTRSTWSTALHGSIQMYASQGALCVASENGSSYSFVSAKTTR